MRLEITQNTIRLIGIGAGVLFGLLPLIMGLLKRNRKLGAIGFVSCVIGGAILGIYLAIPLSALFLWLILKKPAAAVSPENVSFDSNETSETANSLNTEKP